jgi:hypothetical protein
MEATDWPSRLKAMLQATANNLITIPAKASCAEEQLAGQWWGS